MGADHAQLALEVAECEHYERLLLKTLHFRRALNEEGTLACVPHGSGPAAAEAERRLRLWGLQMDLVEGLEIPFLCPHLPDPVLYLRD